MAGIDIQNFYIPAGGDLPDRALNRKFDHKLDFYEKLTAAVAARDPKAPLIVTGDLNVAPSENDVWNHKYMLKVVSHTPAEIEAMWALQRAGQFTDLVREANPEDVVLIAGKGHETYQEIAGTRLPFSDVQVARAALQGRD